MSAHSIYMSDQHTAFRSSVRHFLSEQIVPCAEQWELERSIPTRAWRMLGEHGLLGLLHPTKLGGSNHDLFHSIVFLEELGRIGYGGLRAGISVHAYMATHYLGKYATSELQEQYLRPAIRGEKTAALAITEWDAGSDLSRLTTSAEVSGDDFVINGTKTFITNGINANFFVLAVRTQKPAADARRANTGISLLLVDASAPGIQRTPQEKLGWHAAGTAEIRFTDVRVPVTNLIGRSNSGFMYLMRGFQLERLVAAALSLGGVERCIESTLTHVRSRPAFDGRLADLQTIRHRLANLTTELFSTRALTYHAAWMYLRDELSAKECSMAKLQATELACRAADECLQLQGARGYLAGSDIARIYRDSRAGSMAGGASEVMRDIIAQQIIDMQEA
ncbi:acyl-CoA dehydrogenase family protein [Uliginosibacterium sp. H3]|uniref:Acyl-CoA dehydrogenase family protein n=1 Tax=Uliginosibacterium silvisoli TaxID=3114758 RepID=A0ABU6K7N0_9RHOO|nr:acyl-CoA dehydrogenase family protein [Uliginosibacterium sp. H3]